MIFTLGLLIYHIQLVINNITTKEELGHAFNKVTGNPYDRSFKRNIRIVFCPIIPKQPLLGIMIEKEHKRIKDRSVVVNKYVI